MHTIFYLLTPPPSAWVPDDVVLVFLFINQQKEMKIWGNQPHGKQARRLGREKCRQFISSFGYLQAAGLTRHYANKIRRRVTCPNVVPLKLQYGSSGFVGAFHSMLYRHIMVVRSSRALIYVCPCCTVAHSESRNPKRLSAPCSKLSMWQTFRHDFDVSEVLCFCLPIVKCGPTYWQFGDGRNAVEQVLIEKLLVTQPSKN
jgi:hypothetical protein